MNDTEPTIAGATSRRRSGRERSSAASTSSRASPTRRPPFGAGRLRPPRPVEPWSGVRDALAFGAEPPQLRAAGRPPAAAHGLGPGGAGRGLPQPQRLDAGPGGARPAGHGLDPGRDVRGRVRGDLRRQPLRARRRRVRDDQLPGRRRGVPLPRRRRRQPGPARPGRRAGVGPRQHRGLRRRPGQRHGLRRVGRRDERRHAARDPAGGGAVPAGHPAERGGGAGDRRRDGASAIGRELADAARRARRRATRSPRCRRSGCWPATAELKADLLADPDPERWGLDVIASMLPWQPVVDGRRRSRRTRSTGSRAGAAAVRRRDRRLEHRRLALFVAANGSFERVTDDILAGPVAEHGFEAAAAYGVGPERPRRVPGRVPGRGCPAEVLAAIETDWWCRDPGPAPGRGARGRPGADLHVRVRLALAARRADRRLPRPRDRVRVRHAGPRPGADARADARAGAAAGARGRDARRLGRRSPPRATPAGRAYEPARRATMRFDTVSARRRRSAAVRARLWGARCRDGPRSRG